MGNFGGNNSSRRSSGGSRGGFGGGGNRGGGRSFGGNRNNFNREDREMHKAVCSDCRQDCEVPFKPAEGKPVYCKDCYPKHKKF